MQYHFKNGSTCNSCANKHKFHDLFLLFLTLRLRKNIVSREFLLVLSSKSMLLCPIHKNADVNAYHLSSVTVKDNFRTPNRNQTNENSLLCILKEAICFNTHTHTHKQTMMSIHTFSLPSVRLLDQHIHKSVKIIGFFFLLPNIHGTTSHKLRKTCRF